MIDVLVLKELIQTAINCAKGISAGIKAIKDFDQKMAILELRQQQLDLIDSLQNAKEKIQELHAQLVLQQNMEHQVDGNIFWKIEGEKRFGPYCAACYGSAGKAITLSKREEGNAWDCPVCKVFFATKEWHDNQRKQHQKLLQSQNY